MVRQGDDAGAEADMACALGGAGNEQFRAGDDLEPAGVMLADSGFVIVEPVEVKQKLHVAIECEQRVFVQRMKGSEKNPRLQKPVLHKPDLLIVALPISIVAITGPLTS
jgi:hypothetical protein